MPRKHTNGQLLDDKGNVIGRWDDNRDGVRQWAMVHNQDMDKAEQKWRNDFRDEHGGPGDAIVKKVERYYKANQFKPGGGKNWLRVLVAFGQYQERGIVPMSAAEAQENVKKWGGWREIARRLEALEDANYAFAHGYDPTGGVYAEDGTDGYVAPDDERWGNARQAEVEKQEDGYHKASDDGIPPEHVDRFCEYLERERLVVAKDCGSQHPAIKCKVYEGYIEDVRSGERVHSQIMFNYEQFLGWLRGEYPQRTADETSLWADGGADDHSEAAVKAQLAQQKKLREATPSDNEALAKRTQEILAKAAKDAPTPADIAAAVAAGDWHKVAELAKAQAKAQVPPPGYVWFGWIRQGSVASGQYICIGDGEYEEAILYLASDFGGTEPKPRLYQQNALNGPCRVRHSYDWNDCRREGPFLKTWEEIRAEYGNI